MIRRLNKSHDLEFHHIIRTGIPFPRRFPLTIHHLDLRYDEINRIVSKRHRIYIYISSYGISVSPLSLPLLFFFDSQRLKPQSMHGDYVAYSQRGSTRHYSISWLQSWPTFIMQSSDAICLKNEKALHT